MATLNTSNLVSSFSNKTLVTKAIINIPKHVTNISLPGLRIPVGLGNPIILQKSTEKQLSPIQIIRPDAKPTEPNQIVVAKLYAILEAVSDRVEMHTNIGEQRNNWNSLLLTSINAITLTAATMTGIAASITVGSRAEEALKLSSVTLYVAATGMLSIMNKIQPSQLAEEQRNAVRLFKQLQSQIQTLIAMKNGTNVDVKDMMEKVLALDNAYPLPLLGAMIEKFPKNVEPAVWWTESSRRKQSKGNEGYNGWNMKLEEEMREISNVIRVKDKKEYLKLGEKALQLNKCLAISGPVLTGLAAVGSAALGTSCDGGWAAIVGVLGGALASVVNALEHGGQVGMVFEMYRSNAGFFAMMEESIGANLNEEESERRENGEVFEMKVGLQLGRSLSQLRGLAVNEEEFASKLF